MAQSLHPRLARHEIFGRWTVRSGVPRNLCLAELFNLGEQAFRRRCGSFFSRRQRRNALSSRGKLRLETLHNRRRGDIPRILSGTLLFIYHHLRSSAPRNLLLVELFNLGEQAFRRRCGRFFGRRHHRNTRIGRGQLRLETLHNRRRGDIARALLLFTYRNLRSKVHDSMVCGCELGP